MRGLGSFLKDYFEMNRRERNGTYILLTLIFLTLGISYLLPLTRSSDTADFALTDSLYRAYLQAEIKEDSSEEESEPDLLSLARENSVESQFFDFDPNTLNEAGFKKLGLNDYQVKIILNYRNKGGRFYKPHDFSKIYSIKNEQYEALAPYIHIEQKTKLIDTFQHPKWESPLKRAMVKVDLNTADSISLLQVNGIGPAFASRIIKYRTLLGGFSELVQLKEVYGIDSMAFYRMKPQLILENTSLKTININTATVAEMGKHPYLGWKIAKLVVAYREQHGAYASPEDIQNIRILNAELLPKLLPYIRIK